MPWDDERYPPSMRNLPPPVRAEGSAIRIAIAQAKRWGQVHAACSRRG
ncbi:hypothetical protein [Burkholderia metallica]|nr:hypothetical protein [Burkholderia metallica]MCA8003400.1 hypothetical protein [Burkholderia metallica]